MKKFSLCILAGLLALVLYLEPFSVKAETLPGTDAPTVSMTSISLEESEKWILDEVLSDYVSEHVVDMEEASVPCTIGELIDRGTSSYLCLLYTSSEKSGLSALARNIAPDRENSP